MYDISLFIVSRLALFVTRSIYEEIKKPNKSLLALEASRALAEMSMLPAAAPLLKSAPMGDGHPVLVCPGFLAGDNTTAMLATVPFE